MTQDKAREYFSAYHEGTLEPGLRSALERRFASDSALKAEFEAFVEAVAMLDGIRHEAIPTPAYLSDRISARLEGTRANAAPRSFWSTLFAPRAATPRLAWAMGVAGLLLVSAVGLRGMGVSGANQSSFLPQSAPSIAWKREGNALRADFEGGAARTVSIQPEGGDAKRYALDAGQRFDLTLDNPNAEARRFKISSGDDWIATVALPGRQRRFRETGTGTVTELATAVADFYNVPVVIRNVPMGTTLNWKLGGTDAWHAANDALDGAANASLMGHDGNEYLQIGG